MSEAGQNISNPVANIYFNAIYKTAVKMAGLKKDDVCLDFGCGNKRLRQFLSGQKYIGFDADKAFSDVNDYRKTQPSVVFALNVLEHLDDRQVAEFADWVCRARPRIVVVSMPREARANRIFNFLTQHEFVNGIEHINEWKNVGRILMKRLELVGYKRIFLMQWASAWKVKG